MMGSNRTYTLLVLVFMIFRLSAQSVAFTDMEAFEEAYELAFDDKYQAAKTVLLEADVNKNDQLEAQLLLAHTHSWAGQYGKARELFNKITTVHRSNRTAWISAVKNELYAGNNAIAIGLANKGLVYIPKDRELLRLLSMAKTRYAKTEYPALGWHNQDTRPAKKATKVAATGPPAPEQITEPELPKNRIGVNNSFTVFSERYDPMIFSSVSFLRRTKFGSIIPRINYSNRLGQHGVQFDIDLYPKIAKKMYAYINYGYSNAEIYPSHKFGGDLYWNFNIPAAFEFSAGGRFIKTRTQDITIITNSLGHYSGNYYFSLRSYITPRPDNLTRFSSNLLVRKYFRDGENFLGFNVGMGFSPELRQYFSGEELLSETILYIETQRLNLEYQFTSKNSPNIYRMNLGVRRQELAFDSGRFFWGISAGINYQVKF
ncbi:YaiO family outer membrane beta-barrel protein [Flagellimonas sp. DF-77]|uniref:YaiO family outer membrane beta-barrel protein n=1 Tax=Flagellimonas algarum TaxID=3230298 RepID=UPI00339A267F